MLDDESAEALTMNTLKGPGKVHLRPFGLSVAPRLVPRGVASLLTGIPGVVLTSALTVAEHNDR